MENAKEDALQYKETVFVPEMGVHPVERQEKAELTVFEVEKEVIKFIEVE